MTGTPRTRAGSTETGRFLVDGRSPDAGVLVVNDFATAIEFEGSRVVARPRDGLTAYRLPAAPRVRSIALGLGFDRWATSIVRYQVWPRSRSARGEYRIVLSLPLGLNARQVTFELDGSVDRSIMLEPGTGRTVRIPVSDYPVPVLRIVTDRADHVGGGTPNARLLSLRIPSISYVPKERKK